MKLCCTDLDVNVVEGPAAGHVRRVVRARGELPHLHPPKPGGTWEGRASWRRAG